MSALHRLLMPLARYLVSVGITYPVFAELLKRVFVEAARQEAQATGGRVTDSRLTLLSGVHRKDIRRLTREGPVDEEAPPMHAIGTSLVARWLSDRHFLDAEGKPLPLPRSTTRGGAASFAALAQSVSADVRPRAILDELARLGVVRVDQDLVYLEVGGFVPRHEPTAHARNFGEALHDHIAAGTHNLRGAGPAFLERSVYYDELSPAAAMRIADRAESLAMGMLTEINRQGEAEERADPPSDAERTRMRLGVYFYAEPVAKPQPLKLVSSRPAPAGDAS
jgi:hypothetical protein